MNYKEKVIALLNSQELSKEQKEKLENIFPELKKSEDEKVRKALIELVKYAKGNCLETELFHTQFNAVSMDAMLAWLEKQGEQKSTDKAEPKFKAGDWL